MEVMRVSISEGTKPVYVQMMLTTGTLMAGKMSTGVRVIMTGAARNNSSARTTKVYGRESAMRTIHIEGLEDVVQDGAARTRPTMASRSKKREFHHREWRLKK